MDILIVALLVVILALIVFLSVRAGKNNNESDDFLKGIDSSMELQRTSISELTKDIQSFNEPLIEPCNIPNFNERLNLIGKQVIQYTHMYGFNKELVDLAVQLKML